MPKSAPDIAPVYAISGKEPFLRRQAVGDLLRAVESAESDVQPTTFDGDSAALADVLDEVRTYSLLGGRRVVVVEDADGFITKHRPALEKYCESPAECGTLVFVVDNFDKRTRLYKIVGKIGRVVECPPLSAAAVPGWLVRRCQEAHGKTLAMNAAVRLRELTSNALDELDAELAKLALYVGDRPRIECEDVEALVSDLHEENVFALLDAMNEGNAGAAIGRWRQVLATDRAAQGRSIAGLAWGVRQLLEARRAYDQGTSPFAMAGRMRTDGAALKQRLDRTTTRALEHRLAGLLDADVAVKTSASDIGVLIEKWIVRHSATR